VTKPAIERLRVSDLFSMAWIVMVVVGGPVAVVMVGLGLSEGLAPF
jgi:hypothetical protein